MSEFHATLMVFVFILPVVPAMLIGALIEQSFHRRYCDCRDCTTWRARHAKDSEKLKWQETK